MSCTTKTILTTGIKLGDDMSIGPGIYTPKGLGKSLLRSARKDYMRETAGNPFQGLGLGLMSSMGGLVENMVETVIDDVCEG